MKRLKKFLLYLAAISIIILIAGYYWLTIKWKENISEQEFEKFAQEIINTPEFPERVYTIFGKTYLYDESTSTWEMIFKRVSNPNKVLGCGCMDANYPFETKTFNRISLALKLDKTVGPKKCIDFFS